MEGIMNFDMAILLLAVTLIGNIYIIFLLILYRRDTKRKETIVFNELFRMRYDNEFSRIRREKENDYLSFPIEYENEFPRFRRKNESDFSDFPKAYDSLRSEIKNLRFVLAEDLGEIVDRQIIELRNIEKTQVAEISQSNPDFLIRELSHSLFTPLSQIEAATISLPAKIPEECNNLDIESSLHSIRTSVAICKSVLSAFREQISTSSTTVGWSVPSLSEMIRSAVLVYCEKFHKNIDVIISISEIEIGYSNNFLTAIMMPLLENAVEASPPNSNILVNSELKGNSYIIEITNKLIHQPISDQLYQSGFTTKDGHEGIGLTVVQHLLAIRKGATLTHLIKGKKITFAISLPVRVENEN
jgi:signal transduction histidine kinase